MGLSFFLPCAFLTVQHSLIKEVLVDLRSEKYRTLEGVIVEFLEKSVFTFKIIY